MSVTNVFQFTFFLQKLKPPQIIPKTYHEVINFFTYLFIFSSIRIKAWYISLPNWPWSFIMNKSQPQIINCFILFSLDKLNCLLALLYNGSIIEYFFYRMTHLLFKKSLTYILIGINFFMNYRQWCIWRAADILSTVQSREWSQFSNDSFNFVSVVAHFILVFKQLHTNYDMYLLCMNMKILVTLY